MGIPSVRMYIMPEVVHNAGPRIVAVVVAAATTKTFVDQLLLLLDARQIYNGFILLTILHFLEFLNLCISVTRFIDLIFVFMFH